ncbi:short chain dehydrogenase [Piscirickettsia litoralis]|uniref:Short chain dehydrogenase n=1 Tax=Piscirickettsia litoralis TaxID=1891921 RepID=A0ABX3A0Q6_9GAMM|nr:short chain dehydrogenase [Piscirickettsia litoralis]ODN42437.1 short chain dehydrogenase [Piscirickettsia litoralis]
MKILVVGGTGLIGQAVVSELKDCHDVIVAGYSDGDVQVDITDVYSIQQMYRQVGPVDAIVATTGKVTFAPLEKLQSTDYQLGLDNKLMGQVNLVLEGIENLNPGGSFTLTSGILNIDPIAQGMSAAMVNGAVEGFVRGSAIEMPNSLRINAVSPTVVEEALGVYQDYFRGFKSVPVKEVALAFSKSIEGKQTGQVYRAGW